MTNLPLSPADATSNAYGINDAGDVVGYAQGTSGSTQAVIWHRGAITFLPTAATLNGAAAAISSRGVIVGFATFSTAASGVTGAIWSPGRVCPV